MNKNRFFLFLMMCLPLLTSCSDDGGDVIDDPEGYRGERVAVAFSSPEIAMLTRATDVAFEANDTINISVVNLIESPDSTLQSQNYADGVRYVSNGSDFSEVSDTIYQYKNVPLNLVYYALYPHRQDCAPVFTFAVNADQSTHAGYSLSDLAMQKVASKNLSIELSLVHKLCKVEIVLTGSNLDAKTISQPRLVNMCYSVQVDQSAQTVTTHATQAADTLSAISAQEISRTNTEYRFHAIVAPQQLKAGQHFVTVDVDGVERPLKAAADVTLTSGNKYVYTYNLDNLSAARGVAVTEF